SACIDNEARYNQARQYGFSEKMSFLPGTSYVIFFRGLNGRGQSLLSYRLVSDGNCCLFQRGHGEVSAKAEGIKQIKHGVKGESLDFCVCQVGHSGLLHPKALSCF
ncbi:MAG: hypothetical protein KZQ66_20790, partial [Candidatus Thiodiazotropha sp. (ex Lucinoma aequizonata)]|nr:hypothetical protein [Candidatus Thiodiazotropha sp. (ex Lucinoma aequizonata)]MCU7896906.1 hypothetical protein [Candidatus Thiodiazotropha sp. (ex Lucinoma aequizonata)]MCU7899441.1 hypothetical protein [Candidatus Thiodiazotropha sp. (ex Lucinoma aequizonata)]MCU7904111.1 hypothetical protein [Candidatus Thiodiazotropha sp. (ex Lucinoma aequizonata)]MCU7911236.1 hypothetical protein [Candidatus Thiodiazotropha sp. (ex Lucinoma aequizonata)]